MGVMEQHVILHGSILHGHAIFAASHIIYINIYHLGISEEVKSPFIMHRFGKSFKALQLVQTMISYYDNRLARGKL